MSQDHHFITNDDFIFTPVIITLNTNLKCYQILKPSLQNQVLLFVPITHKSLWRRKSYIVYWYTNTKQNKTYII